MKVHTSCFEYSVGLHFLFCISDVVNVAAAGTNALL